MATYPELVHYIRFQLSQLSVRNEHHRFEDLARDFARLRICERILPATGPVAGSGDQGRDFESFRSYLASTPIATSTFLSDDPTLQIVFACTLQQKSLSSKIRSDVGTIFSSSYKPDRIVFFCEANLKVATRHQLQDWCAEHFDAELEIFDGTAIAENLASNDVFWIAQEYLGVPADMFPRETNDPDWYADHKNRWLAGDRRPQNFSDFVEIKQGIRRATFDKVSKPDLPGWIETMRRFLTDESTSALRRQAIYEICVAALRGLNNLTAEAGLVIEYFSDIDELSRPSELEDAVTLASYCSTAFIQGHFKADIEDLHQWSRSLKITVDERLQQAVAQSTKCQLLVTAGRVEWLPYAGGLEPDYDICRMFDRWEELFDEIDDAPLFPVESFSDLLVAMTPFVGDDPRFVELTRRIDNVLTERSGDYLAAEKCRDRALAYWETGNVLMAMKQLHESKTRWFSSETMRGSLLSMLVLSRCYSTLGLHQAAKYYASGAMFVVARADDEELNDLMPQASMQFSDACYSSGEWLNFLATAWIGLAAHNIYRRDPQELQNYTSLQRVLFHGAVARVIARRFVPEVAEVTENFVAQWPLDPLNASSLDALCDDKEVWINAESRDDISSQAISEMGCAPYSDLGDNRSITWKALGITWVVEGEQKFTTVLMLEEFCSFLQIVIADLAGTELCLLPLNAHVEIEVDETLEAFEIENLPDNDVARYRVTLPVHGNENRNVLDGSESAAFACGMAILGECTLLPRSRFLDILETAMRQGLSTKAFSVRPYSELIQEFFQEDDFRADIRAKTRPLVDQMQVKYVSHEQLRWPTSPGPGYSKEKSEQFIRNRYRRAIKPIRRSLEKWRQDPDFQLLIERFRNEGMRDWHILLLLANATVNARVHNRLGSTAPIEEIQELTIELIDREETEEDFVLPPTFLTLNDLEFEKKTAYVSIAATWGLQVKQQTPHFDALKRVLEIRYRISVDDVDHDDIFGNTE